MTTKRQLQKTYRKLLLASGHESFRAANRRRGQLIDKRLVGPLVRSEREEHRRLSALVDARVAWECYDSYRAGRKLSAWLERIIGRVRR